MLLKSVFREIKSDKLLYTSAAMLYLIALYHLPKYGHSWDTYCWEQWTALVQKHGVGAAYADGSPVNYLPLFMYILKAFSWFFKPEELAVSMYLLKPVSLLFDFASALLIVKMLPAGNKRAGLFILALINPGFSYNTYIWNQVDGILSFFVLLSLQYALNKKTLHSAIAFLLAFNFKLQAIVFLPLIGLLWLPELNAGRILRLLLTLALLQTLIILPFVLNGHGDNMLAVVVNSVDYFNYVSMNAFNVWHFVFEGNLTEMKDTITVGGIMSAKQLGLLMFFTGSGLLLAPVLINAVKKLMNQNVQDIRREQIYLTGALIICFFFYFNTQMHERYIHPLMLFSCILAFVYGHWLQWVLFSLCYALSLESLLHYTGYNLIPEYLLKPKFLAGVYASGILLLLWSWFKLKPFKTN